VDDSDAMDTDEDEELDIRNEHHSEVHWVMFYSEALWEWKYGGGNIAWIRQLEDEGYDFGEYGE
jgi:hypothetical protein